MKKHHKQNRVTITHGNSFSSKRRKGTMSVKGTGKISQEIRIPRQCESCGLKNGTYYGQYDAFLCASCKKELDFLVF